MSDSSDPSPAPEKPDQSERELAEDVARWEADGGAIERPKDSPRGAKPKYRPPDEFDALFAGQPRLMDAKNVAAILGFSEKTIYRWAKLGRIPCRYLNGNPRFPRQELIEWARAGGLERRRIVNRTKKVNRPKKAKAGNVDKFEYIDLQY
jgi:predicted DNA-binding transcriptional regulator AlpA